MKVAAGEGALLFPCQRLGYDTDSSIFGPFVLLMLLMDVVYCC